MSFDIDTFILVWFSVYGSNQSLKHQRKWKSDPNYTKSWYDRGAKIGQADKYRKGACQK